MKIVRPNCFPNCYNVNSKELQLNWKKTNEDRWTASRLYYDGVSKFFYNIYGNDSDGYTAEAMNTAFLCMRVAVKNKRCKKESVFHSLDELKKRIEDGTQLWLYERTGEITEVEY